MLFLNLECDNYRIPTDTCSGNEIYSTNLRRKYNLRILYNHCPIKETLVNKTCSFINWSYRIYEICRDKIENENSECVKKTTTKLMSRNRTRQLVYLHQSYEIPHPMEGFSWLLNENEYQFNENGLHTKHPKQIRVSLDVGQV